MDLHKPKPWNGWRDFLKEVGTIVLGVGIALAAEQLLEYFHHRSQLQVARRELAAELAENRHGMEVNRAQLPVIEAELAADMALLRRSRPSPGPLVGKLDYSIAGMGWRTGAWQTVQQNGSLELMPHVEMQNYAHLYGVLDVSGNNLVAQVQGMDRAAAIADRIAAGPVTTKDIEDLIAATSDAQARAMFQRRTFNWVYEAMDSIK